MKTSSSFRPWSALALTCALWACEASGPPEADVVSADANMDVAGLPIPMPANAGITCEGRKCGNEAGDFMTLAAKTATIGPGTGLAIERIDDDGTVILRPDSATRLTERPRAVISTDPPLVAVVTSMRVLDDGLIELTTERPSFIGDVVSDFDIDQQAPLEFGEPSGPLAEFVTIEDAAAADSATPSKPKLSMKSSTFSYAQDNWTVTLSELDVEVLPTVQFVYVGTDVTYEWNYTEATARSRGIVMRLMILQPVTVSAKVAFSLELASHEVLPDDYKTWTLVKLPFRIPVLGFIFWLSGEVGLRFVQSLEAEASIDFENTVSYGGTALSLMELDVTGKWTQQRVFVPSQMGAPTISLSGKVTYNAGLELYLWLSPWEFDESAKAEVIVGARFQAELSALASIGGTFGAAIKWVLKVFFDVKLKLEADFSYLIGGAKTGATWTPFKREVFLNCGQCATWFDGCRQLCDRAGCAAKCDCVPSCTGKACGSDGCGGSCGTCTSGNKTACNTTTATNVFGAAPGACYCSPTFALGKCKSSCGTFDDTRCASTPTSPQHCDHVTGNCTPSCPADACGVQPNGVDCGGCGGADETCINGLCVACGTCDGCGGTDDCGRVCDCPDGQACEQGACVEACPQGCMPDEYCEADVCVGCAEDCGTNAYCSQGACVACATGCSSSEYCDRGQCVGCAADCGNQAYCLYGTCVACAATCAPGTRCVEGACEPCDCGAQQCGSDGCGGSCGQCDTAAGEACQDGLCEPCQPQCDGKTCGDDGCGGSCGTCATGTVCVDGACAVCTPDCTDKLCGPNGCGGQCGTCNTAAGEACTAGRCLGVPLEETCVSRAAGDRCCDSRDDDCRSASGRCFCDTFCATANDCCADYDAECPAP